MNHLLFKKLIETGTLLSRWSKTRNLKECGKWKSVHPSRHADIQVIEQCTESPDHEMTSMAVNK